MRHLITEFTPLTPVWIAKLVGACAGSAISLAYILPHGKREAGIRFLTGIIAGMVFGVPAGFWLVEKLEITGLLDVPETALLGAAFSSLTIWTALGVAKRMTDRIAGRPSSDQVENKREHSDANKT